jgi:uncharacterized protein (TIGR02231 family)
VAIPRLDKDAFLQAQVTQWEDLNLLPGETNIFFEGSFVGNGNIDMRNIKDTMNISLGRDKKIIVKREIDKKLHSRKTIGTNERESIAYSIIARNTRKEDIDLVIYDQLPISTDASIIVEDAEYGDALLDETTKSLRWIMSLKPAESKKVQLSYTVKYPKGKTVNNIR